MLHRVQHSNRCAGVAYDKHTQIKSFPLPLLLLLLLLLQGVNFQSLVFPGEAHDELAWRKRLHLPLEFLFGDARYA
jgi:hypothetical protein